MFCPNGHENEDDTVFCIVCDEIIDEPIVEEETQQQENTDQTVPDPIPANPTQVQVQPTSAPAPIDHNVIAAHVAAQLASQGLIAQQPPAERVVYVNNGPMPQKKPRTEVFAIYAILMAFLFPPLGAVLGVIALNKIRKSRVIVGGNGLASIAIVIGIFFTFIGVLSI